MALRLLTVLVFIATVVQGCDCIAFPAREAKKGSEIVFRGTVVRIRKTEKGEPMVTFKVTRVWKGPVTAEFEMLGLEGDACFTFYPGLLGLGNEVLVYASKLGQPSAYVPRPCDTALVQNAKDIRKLGRGRKPKSN